MLADQTPAFTGVFLSKKRRKEMTTIRKAKIEDAIAIEALYTELEKDAVMYQSGASFLRA